MEEHPYDAMPVEPVRMYLMEDFLEEDNMDLMFAGTQEMVKRTTALRPSTSPALIGRATGKEVTPPPPPSLLSTKTCTAQRGRKQLSAEVSGLGRCIVLCFDVQAFIILCNHDNETSLTP